jgi:hypothetical protein
VYLSGVRFAWICSVPKDNICDSNSSKTTASSLYIVPQFISMALLVHSGPRHLIQFRNHFSHSTTPWSSVQPVARTLPEHRTTQTHNNHIPNIHTLSGIQTHEPSVRSSKENSCHRPRGHSDRLFSSLLTIILSLSYFKRH